MADFVILEENLFEVPADSIQNVCISATYLGASGYRNDKGPKQNRFGLLRAGKQETRLANPAKLCIM